MRLKNIVLLAIALSVALSPVSGAFSPDEPAKCIVIDLVEPTVGHGFPDCLTEVSGGVAVFMPSMVNLLP